MYTYAFYKTPFTPLALPKGIAALLQTVKAAQISAVVESDVSLEALQQDDARLMQAVLDHDRILCHLFLQTTILPLRFGTSFHSLPDLLAHLDKQQQTYLSQLSQLDGKAEYPLKLMPVEFPELLIAPEIKGKDYFLAKRQQYQAHLLYQKQQQESAQQIEQAVTQAYPQHYCSDTQTGDKTIYLLAERAREPLLRRRVQSLQKAYRQIQLVLGDALPPYHFVTG